MNYTNNSNNFAMLTAEDIIFLPGERNQFESEFRESEIKIKEALLLL